MSGRLSLRQPQRASLDILAQVADTLPLSKDQDMDAALAAVRAISPAVSDFERDFPSLCFALATGVGKTRLMGAFISYLYLAKGIRNFFVLAPNLTIYDKLIRDFTPGNPKYVFQGIAEFAQDPPEVITGDNYETGRGVRGSGDLFGERTVHVNIFNISKINSEVRGGKEPRIKRLKEYIGESYFEYLSALPDLVLLMDESHRYRASAGVRAINELKPVLGLELTATPFVETGTTRTIFQNVAYEYPLANAIKDGFVKDPAVATRENFRADDLSAEQLERVKLEDGIRLHELAKVELETYARQYGRTVVKPFMLVIASDTTHAAAIEHTIRSEEFFGGKYAGRVITVHSNQRGEEKEETVQRLLAVERADEPTEIVIHVNMLKEGWDVTNLYTIVPLRAANARTLVEQSIGRGLRLPYGRRTGVKAVDRLTIVAHDKFQEIVDEAQRGDSVIRMEVVVLGRDVPDSPQETVIIPTVLEAAISTTATAATHAGPATEPAFATDNEREIARAVVATLPSFGRLPSSRELCTPEVRAQVIQAVHERLAPAQLEIAVTDNAAVLADVVDKVIALHIEHTIDIPRIVVVPTGEVTTGFHDFNLDLGNLRLQPVDSAILIQQLQDGERTRLETSISAQEPRPENYIVRALVDYDDISYDEHASLLYKLAGQAVDHLRSYLPDEDSVENVLQSHHRRLAELIHTRMQEHYWQSQTDYEGITSRGAITMRNMFVTDFTDGAERPFREPVDDLRDIKRLRFTGFRKCVYTAQKFDSDAERRLAIMLEAERSVLKWVKPGPGTFRIDYAMGNGYDPDFVVELTDRKLICEPKRADEMADPIVLSKARAAAEWCKYATEHEMKHGGKPWSYLLIPHTAITASATVGGLEASYTFALAASVAEPKGRTIGKE